MSRSAIPQVRSWLVIATRPLPKFKGEHEEAAFHVTAPNQALARMNFDHEISTGGYYPGGAWTRKSLSRALWLDSDKHSLPTYPHTVSGPFARKALSKQETYARTGAGRRDR